MTTAKILLVFMALLGGITSFAQPGIDSLFGKVDPQKWMASVESKSQKLSQKIINKSTKTLTNMQRQEEKVYRRLLKTADSLKAKEKLTDLRNKYKALFDRLGDSGSITVGKIYLPKLDSVSTALIFLEKKGVKGNLTNAIKQTQHLQDKFQQAEEIKAFIRDRRQQLKDGFQKLGVSKALKKINKQVYYYSAQINEYKEMLKDTKKAERKALEILSKTKLFQDFMRKNSMLASLFRLPGNGSDPAAQANLAGLQTRAQVNNLIQQQIGSGGPDAQAQFRQNMNQAQAKMNELKRKVLSNTSGNGSSDDEIAEGFKPSQQKTKTFWKRIELGTNIQTQKAGGYWPVTSDLGLSVGYKLSDHSIIGIGASYKLGFGPNFRNIRFTQEGAGLRSFIDWKIKGSFWLSGGYEGNYRTAFSRFEQLKDFSQWQQSGLLGLSKVISLKTKFFKNTKLQLLWDFLSYEQVPRTQPVIFRIGYNF